MKKDLQVKFCSEPTPCNSPMWDELALHNIDEVNWADFSYKPKVNFRICHNGAFLFIKFDVVEHCLPRIECRRDQDPVYQDSCVEFFILDKNGSYHNFEFNASGVCLSASGENRANRTPRNMDEMLSVMRIPLGVDELENGYYWSLIVGIPFAICQFQCGMSYDVNFYKCGDLTEQKHYLSWNKIDSEKPDFHRPDCFGTMTLE